MSNLFKLSITLDSFSIKCLVQITYKYHLVIPIYPKYLFKVQLLVQDDDY